MASKARLKLRAQRGALTKLQSRLEELVKTKKMEDTQQAEARALAIGFRKKQQELIPLYEFLTSEAGKPTDQEIETLYVNQEEDTQRIVDALAKLSIISEDDEVAKELLLSSQKTSDFKEQQTTEKEKSPYLPAATLPKLELPKFSGDIQKWPAFYKSFCEKVHDNPHLGKSAKFGYLIMCLKGTALEEVEGFNNTDEDYDDAIETLKDSYSDPKQVKRILMNKLRELPRIKDINDTGGMDKLYKHVKIHILKLNKSGIPPDQYAEMLFAMIRERLPVQMQISFNRKFMDDSDEDEEQNLNEEAESTTSSVFKTKHRDLDNIMSYIKKETRSRRNITAPLGD
jgi:hypothetical protein